MLIDAAPDLLFRSSPLGTLEVLPARGFGIRVFHPPSLAGNLIREPLLAFGGRLRPECGRSGVGRRCRRFRGRVEPPTAPDDLRRVDVCSTPSRMGC
jgi:hypothetical protein